MAHSHPISDDDRLFVIDPTNRSITYEGDNIVLVKGDHNSEVFSFEIPRIVEGHDMSLCDHVRIHYSNTDRRRKNESKDIYYVTDCVVNGDVVNFSWTLSGNATKYYGTLTFLIQFCCLDEDGTYSYIWTTDTYKSIPVHDSYSNSEGVIENYADVFDKIFLQLEKVPDTLSDLENDVGAVFVNDSASVGQIIKVAAVDDTGKPTAWEPADLPDWEQIDEKVGNLDDLETEAKNNLVDAVNEAMTKGGVTEDYVDNAIQESGYYRQFPFKSIEISKSGGILYFYVNIEDLDDGVQYYLSPSEKEKRKYKELYPNLRLFMVCIYMECDDGTQKRLITGTGPVTYRFRLFTTNKCRLYKSNEVLEIDYSDRSTSSAIKTNYIYNSYYLTTGGNAEYIPTTEYSPATKKYVDDEVKAAANSDTPKSHYLLTDSGNGFEYYIKMKNGSLISFCKAEKIEVTTLPTTTEYVAGATLDLTGMVVTLTRQDGTTEEIAGYTTTETVPADGVITVTYVEENVEYTTTFNVTIEGES